ncbi:MULTISPECIES: DUF1616 domain-containing protein [Haloferax]|uniref:DUF1616 family protein n=1 Tax=Haloferax gibbonsii TaxID=35746 RepID=A0A871BLE7_HALGI|nr:MULTISPECIES: DUF1616 domain-containing protein [Haloferax]QOS13585.1 DUF1616 family protein [Haloferax gibbonsii]WEL28091.1 Membrane associated protein with extracellular Ig-like domain [Haloferax lucentense]
MVEIPVAKNTGLRRVLGALPADIVVGLAILVGASLSVVYVHSVVVRAVFGIPLLVFLPGYAFLLVLFPHDYSDPRTARPALRTTERPRTGITFLERTVLSFGVSLALVPVFGILLLAIAPRVDSVTVVTGFGAGIAVVLVLGEYRRRQLRTTERYVFPIRSGAESVVASFTTGATLNRRLNAVLAVLILVSVVSFGYALTVPNSGEEYTSLSLVTRQSDGEYVASGYPESLSTEGNAELFVSTTNHERELTRYTVVVQLQRVETTSDSVSVVEYEELGRASQAVPPGETWVTSPELRAEMTGTGLRLVYLLYKGDVPKRPTAENAYRSTHIWVSN